MFNALETKNRCVQWIRDFFEENGKGCNAVIGISGGKDSSIVASLCVEALGADRVIGVMMPCGEQADIDFSKRIIAHLGIKGYTLNVGPAVKAVLDEIPEEVEITEQTRINVTPRVRMAALYAVGQSCNGRVANTSNLSEDYVGYSTRYGVGAAGDFAPLARLTVTEVKAIGHLLNIPRELVEKVPADGLSGKTDEDNLGFTYDTLDRYIRTGVCEDRDAKAIIDRKHAINAFKVELAPVFEP